MKLQPFIKNEKYENEYGKLDYRNKKVLDLGADYGSSAEFFLEKGAREVVAVEGDKIRHEELVKNSQWLNNMIPVFLFLNSPNQFSELIEKYKPDIVKSDLDGGEIHLFQIPDSIFSSVKEYTLEVHSMEILKMCLEKLWKNGYQIIEFKKLDDYKASSGIFCDGVLITFVKQPTSHEYLDSIYILFKYWEISRRKTEP